MAIGLFWATTALCVFIALLVVDRMGFFSSTNRFPVNGKTVVVTGASQGMGKSVAEELARRGANVILVARNIRKLAQALTDTTAAAARPPEQRFTYIDADLTSPVSCQHVVREATSWNGGSPPDVLWCCAGVAHPTLFVDTPVEKLKEQMDSNYFTSAYLAHAILDAWLKPDPTVTAPLKSAKPPARHLIFTSSVVAFYPLVGYSPYTPAKTALRALADSLSQELNLYARSGFAPVSVHTIFPGTIHTPGYDAENLIKPDVTKKLEEGDAAQSADQVAIKSIQALEKGEELIVTQFLARFLMCATLGTSRRNGFAILDTVLSWLGMVVLPIIRWSMDADVRQWGLANGSSGKKQ